MTLFFPRIQETTPFFQLFNDLDVASRGSRCHPRSHRNARRSFAPSFDVKETEQNYQLFGELPGISQSDINIEWADDKTISISGRSERNYESTNVEAPVQETGSSADAASVTDEETFEEITADQASYRKPSVEDDAGEGPATPATSVAEQPTQAEQRTSPQDAAKQSKDKFWVSERSLGSFRRTFQFPIRVEHDQVSANLHNGILSITVPKAKPLEPRRIVIS